jgi:outer membrane autotransporter protein
VTVANGSNAAVNVTNNAGGNLYGNVVLGGGTLTNAGNWYPDGANVANVSSTGYIGVALGRTVPSSSGVPPNVLLIGNLQHSGVLQTTVDFANAQASQLRVDGTADLTGSQFSLIPTSTGTQPVTILETSGTLVLGQNTVYDDGLLGLFSYQLSTPDATTLQVTQQAQLSAVAREAGFSRTEQAVAAHLQASFDSGAPGLSDALTQIRRLPSLSQYKRALGSLSNEPVNAIANARLAASQSFVARLNSCPEFVGTGTLQEERECAWGRVIGSWLDRDSTANDIGYSANTQVVQLGGQRRIAPGWFIGGSLAYDTGAFDADANLGDVDSRGVTLGVVLKREVGPWLISGAIDAGYGWYDSTRNVWLGPVPQVASGSFNGQHAGLHGRVAYQMPQDRWYLKPYVDLHATYQRTDGYTETGAGPLNLTVDSNSATRLMASPMIELGGRLDLRNDTVLMPYISVGGLFFNKNEWTTDAMLSGAGVGPFEVTAELPAAQFNLNAGATLTSGKHLQVRLEYVGQFASNYNANSGSLKFSYLF